MVRAEDLIGLMLATACAVYLMYAMLRPEKFS